MTIHSMKNYQGNNFCNFWGMVSQSLRNDIHWGMTPIRKYMNCNSMRNDCKIVKQGLFIHWGMTYKSLRNVFSNDIFIVEESLTIQWRIIRGSIFKIADEWFPNPSGIRTHFLRDDIAFPIHWGMTPEILKKLLIIHWEMTYNSLRNVFSFDTKIYLYPLGMPTHSVSEEWFLILWGNSLHFLKIDITFPRKK